MSNKKSKFAARLLAIILSLLMIVSIAFYTIYMIVENIKADDTEESDGQEHEEGDGHDHAQAPAYTFFA